MQVKLFVHQTGHTDQNIADRQTQSLKYVASNLPSNYRTSIFAVFVISSAVSCSQLLLCMELLGQSNLLIHNYWVYLKNFPMPIVRVVIKLSGSDAGSYPNSYRKVWKGRIKLKTTKKERKQIARPLHPEKLTLIVLINFNLHQENPRKSLRASPPH